LLTKACLLTKARLLPGQAERILAGGMFKHGRPGSFAPGVVLAAAVCVAAMNPAFASGYRPQAPVVAPPRLVNPDFNSGTEGWTLGEDFRRDPQGGRNGTGALRLDRVDPGKYLLTGQVIDLLPGTRYRFGAWIRTANVTGDDSGATICLEFYDGDNFLGGVYPNGIKGTRDWTLVEMTGSTPDKPVKCTLTLYLRKGMTGTAWFDDVLIEPSAGTWSAYQIFPSHGIVDSRQGRILFGSVERGLIRSLPEKVEESDLKCRIRVVSGRETVKEVEASVRGARIAAELGSLPPGPLEIKLSLLDEKHKWLLGEQVVPVTAVVPQTAALNSVRLDEEGRAIVNGKPFLPVGLYASGIAREDIARIAASPFNCVMPYNSLMLKLDGSSKAGVPAVREALDACQAGGIKVIFSLKDVYAGSQWAELEFAGARGEKAVIEKAVSSFRDHPAILAWYINDELPLTLLPRLIDRRREVNRLDPDHPTWAVLYQLDELPYYGSTCDVMGVDPYPIRDGKNRDMRLVLNALEASERAVGTDLGLALWVVPQIFNWGVYECKDRAALLKSYRDPTEAEMRAMALLCALKGARGFVFYSYFDLSRPLAGPDFDRRWPEICRVGRQVRDLEPFLLSSRPALSVTVTGKAGQVLARGFESEDGRRCVLVAGIGPGESTAVVRIPGKELRSKYGLCAPLGDGRYRFTGVDICADVLEEKPDR